MLTVTTVSGYEVEKKTLANCSCPEVVKEVKACFRHLRKHGVLIYTYDDGYSLEVKEVLMSIAYCIGLTFYSSYPHMLLVIDDESRPEFCRDAKI